MAQRWPRQAEPRERSGRLALVNVSDNAALAPSIASVLLAHDLVDGRQHAAAERFRQARARAFGMPLSRGTAGPERRYDALAALLTEDQHMPLVDVAIELWPCWLPNHLRGSPLSGGDQAECQDLLEGLDALAT